MARGARVIEYMKITKDTQLFISIAERPGNSGALMFNGAFQALTMDAIYKPLSVAPRDLQSAVRAVRAFQIRGCGVSMPHKSAIMKYLDEIDPIAKKIGAVNTIVNTNGVLKGYNTDFWGIKKALEEKISCKGKNVLIIGTGGAARAAVLAVRECGVRDITIAGRNENKARALARAFRIRAIPFGTRSDFKTDILVHATSVGMAPHIKEMIVPERAILNFSVILDVVANPFSTALIAAARAQKKITISGYRIALYQAAHQFTLYTGIEAPVKIMEKNLLKLK